MFYTIEIVGTVAFAISGVLTALHKRFDLFGVLIIAFVTSIGGGTIRDVLIGRHPVGWMRDLNYTYAILGGYFIGIFFRKYMEHLRKSLFLFDTIGLGIFTIIGIERGIEYGLHPIICIALGTITACFGGVLRDILCNQVPVIFRREIYATICIVGGGIYFVLRYLNIPQDIITLSTASSIILIRLAAVKFEWRMPILDDPNR